MLRAKAYGPDGEVSAEELVRLQELEGLSSGEGERLRPAETRTERAPASRSVAHPVSSAAASPPPLNAPREGAPQGALRGHAARGEPLRGETLRGDTSPGPNGDDLRGDEAQRDLLRGSLSDRRETKRAERPEGAEASESQDSWTDPAASEAPDPSSDPKLGRRRWPVLAAASAAILAIGLGIGWGIWGQQNRSIPLTDEQQSWQDAVVAEDDYDPGSIIAVREEEGVVAWVATQSAGEQTCLLLSNGEETSAVCRDTEQVMSGGLWGELAIPDSSSESTTWFAQATVMFSVDGHPAANMGTYSTTTDGSSIYASDREQELADFLGAEGYTQSRLWVVGRFEENPVWMGSPEGSLDEVCLVYVTAADEPVADCTQQGEDAEELVLDIVDEEGPTPRGIEMRYGFSPNGPTNLTVTVRPATDSLVDPSIDDKTGESGE